MFEARTISPDTLRAAFAVMQLALPDVDLPCFRKLVAAGRLSSAPGAVVGLFDRRGYIHALFRSFIDRGLGAAQQVRITDFTCGDSISTAIMLEMIEAVEVWGRSLGCERISIETIRRDTHHGLPLSDVLVSRGFSGQSMVLARRI